MTNEEIQEVLQSQEYKDEIVKGGFFGHFGNMPLSLGEEVSACDDTARALKAFEAVVNKRKGYVPKVSKDTAESRIARAFAWDGVHGKGV
jgi:hypothetical protein